MKKMLFGLMVAASSLSAFAADNRIECANRGNRVQVALEGSSNFSTVDRLVIIKHGVSRTRMELQAPNCSTEVRATANGSNFLIANCQEQNLVLNTILRSGHDNGVASVKIGSRTYNLICSTKLD